MPLLFFVALFLLLANSNCQKFIDGVNGVIIMTMLSLLIIWPYFFVAIFGPLQSWLAIFLSIFYLWSNCKLIYKGHLKKIIG